MPVRGGEENILKLLFLLQATSSLVILANKFQNIKIKHFRVIGVFRVVPQS